MAISATNRQPRTVRPRPSPPRMLVPPTMIPVRTVNVRKLPAAAWALRTRDASMVPASAAAVPLSANVATRNGVDPDAAEPRRLGVAAGRVDVAAEGRPAEQDHREDRDDDHHPGAARDAEDLRRGEGLELRVIEHHDEVAVGRDRADAADDERHRERADQRVDPEARDDDAVREPDDQPDRDAGEDPDRRPEQTASCGGGRTGQAVDRADREVDPAGDQDEGAGRRDDDDPGLLVEDVREVRTRRNGGLTIARITNAITNGIRIPPRRITTWRARAPAGRPAGRDRRSSRHAALARPKEAARMASSVMASARSSAEIRPPRMTTTRWARPRTSSISFEMSRIATPPAARLTISS